MSTRTRKRTLRDRSEEEDELTLPVKTADASPLSAAKKRKLNTHGVRNSPSRTTAGSSSLGVLGKLGSMLGYGKENGIASPGLDEEEEDVEGEDLMEEDINGDIVNVEVPETQDSGKRRRSGRVEKQVNGDTPSAGRTEDELARGEDGIWDVADSDPEENNTSAQAQSTANNTPRTATDSDGIKRNKDGSIQKRRGRPKKNPEADPTPRKSVAKPATSLGNSDYRQKWRMLKEAMALSRAAIRDRMIELGQADDAEEYSKEYTALLDEAEVEVDEAYPEDPGPTPTPRKRGRPKKSQTEAFGHMPKGILTPSRGGVLKSKKSVTFGGREDLDLGFRDLPASTKIQRAIELQQDEDSEGSDEVACAICSGVESEEPNEIIFCDNCDLAVHQDCYRVPIIPEGDWLCRDCSTESAPQMEAEEAEINEAPSNLPEIEGFEQHLRSIQRIVLDKLTGQRRIKLRGHDEEMQKVHQVVEQTVLAGEGNSMLVIGARGTGKSTVSSQFASNGHN